MPVLRSILLAVFATIACMRDLAFGQSDCSCTNVPPNVLYTCEQQKEWGQCDQEWMSAPAPFFPQGYCQFSCGKCADGCYPPAPFGCGCTDIPPSSEASCPRQAALGNCNKSWMTAASPLTPYGNCQASCGRCPLGCALPAHAACPCGDIQPPDRSCGQMVAAGACNQAWVSQPADGVPEGFCQASCGRCPCNDEPPDSFNTCAVQAAQGKCEADWMLTTSADTPNGWCMTSCGRCFPGAFCQAFANTFEYEKALEG